MIPALTDFLRFWNIFLISLKLSETVVMKINVKKCLIIIYKHMAHTFFKLQVEQWVNNNKF